MAQALQRVQASLISWPMSHSAGDTITVTDSSGNVVVLTMTATTSFGMWSLLSIQLGETILITTSSGASASAQLLKKAQTMVLVLVASGFPGGVFGMAQCLITLRGYGGTDYGGSSNNTGSVNTAWGQICFGKFRRIQLAQ